MLSFRGSWFVSVISVILIGRGLSNQAGNLMIDTLFVGNLNQGNKEVRWMQ